MFAASLKTIAPRLRLKLSAAKIDNLTFRMHYQLTFCFLFLCGLIVSAKELFGERIKCIADGFSTKELENFINNYCFIMSTFTIKEAYDEGRVRSGEISHPGMGNPANSTIITHKFYQWVPFLLFFQAICFYLPHHIWKKQEGGRLKALVEGLQNAVICGDEDKKVKDLNLLSQKSYDKKMDTVKRDVVFRLKFNGTWSLWLVMMEMLNLVNVVVQVWIIDSFLNGEFIGLGGNVVNFVNWSDARITPLSSIFPLMTKCQFHKYGPSGSLQNHDTLCVMALNVVHEKIFTALWFWFHSLFFMSLAALFWRLASFIMRHSGRFNMLMFRNASSTRLDPQYLEKVLHDCHYGDWLFIYYLAKNMHGSAFSKLLKVVAQELENQQKEDRLGSKKIGFEPMMEHFE